MYKHPYALRLKMTVTRTAFVTSTSQSPLVVREYRYVTQKAVVNKKAKYGTVFFADCMWWSIIWKQVKAVTGELRKDIKNMRSFIQDGPVYSGSQTPSACWLVCDNWRLNANGTLEESQSLFLMRWNANIINVQVSR